MAKASELVRVRKVLDYVPSAEMGAWSGRSYLEALNRRLNREVAVEQVAVRAVRPARDEAVLVVTAEEWDAAQAARRNQAQNQAELEQARQEIEAVHARSAELQREVEELRAKLSGLKVEEERRKVALKLVAVRRPSPPPPLVAPTPGPAVASLEAMALPSREQLESAGWVVVPEGQQSPSAGPWEVGREPSGASEAEAAIRRVEDEILKIEAELANLAQREETLRRTAQRPARAAGGPYTFRGYRLYQRAVGSGDHVRPLYFFAKSTPASGEPVARLPAGFVVGSNPRTGMPYLKRAGGARRRRTRASSSRRR